MGGGDSLSRWDRKVRNERRARIGDKGKVRVLADNVAMGRTERAAGAILLGIITDAGGTGKLGKREEERMLGWRDACARVVCEVVRGKEKMQARNAGSGFGMTWPSGRAVEGG